MMKKAITLLIYIILKVCYSGQYVTLHGKPAKLNPCENVGNTSPVEHFFNVMFTEFQSMPPACVCIQMCLEQPTYCYPNGCLKRSEWKKNENNTPTVNSVNKIQNEGTTKSGTFIVDKQRDLLDDLLDGPGLHYVAKPERPLLTDFMFRPKPLKELVIRYKKLPKLEMKYNLRELIKNTKSDRFNIDKIDISKTRWPLNKHLNRGKQPLNSITHYRKNGVDQQSKFFVSMVPEENSGNYTPIFYKKYLTKRENNNGVNVESLYLFKSEATNFSLETLIDNLIENSLDKSKNDVKFTSSIFNDNIMNEEPMTESLVNCTTINLLPEEDNINASSTTVDVFSINSTSENIDTNRYLHDSNMTNRNTFLEMIITMSKEIDKQNQASLELMERVTGRRSVELYNSSISKSIVNLEKNDTFHINKTDTNINIDEHKVNGTVSYNSTENIPITTYSPVIVNKTKSEVFEIHKALPILRTSIKKKSKQRIVRRLHNRKRN